MKENIMRNSRTMEQINNTGQFNDYNKTHQQRLNKIKNGGM